MGGSSSEGDPIGNKELPLYYNSHYSSKLDRLHAASSILYQLVKMQQVVEKTFLGHVDSFFKESKQ